MIIKIEEFNRIIESFKNQHGRDVIEIARLQAIIDKQRNALEEISMRIGYIKIHGIGAQVKKQSATGVRVVHVGLQELVILLEQIGLLSQEALALTAIDGERKC